MTSSVRRAGVVRAAISLDFPVSGDSEAVQLLTSGEYSPVGGTRRPKKSNFSTTTWTVSDHRPQFCCET